MNAKDIKLSPSELRMLVDKPDTLLKTSSGDFVTGVVLPRNITTPVDFLKDLKDYDYKTSDANTVKKQIDLSNKIYRYEGTVGDACDVLMEFSVTEGKFTNFKNKEFKDLIQFWSNELNSSNYNVMPGIDYFNQELQMAGIIDGNSFPFRYWKNIKFNNKTYKLPMDMYNLNPQAITIDEVSVAYGEKRIIYSPVYSYYTYTNSGIQVPSDNMPSNMSKAIQKGDPYVIDNSLITHLKRKSRNYEGWGIPYLTRAFSAVASKRRLRQLDDVTIQGLVNYLTIIKVGDKDHDPSTAHLSKVKELLASPTPSMTVVMPYYVDVIQVGADGQILSFADKYKEADMEIVRALGIPEILLDGKGQGQTGWIGILALIERMEQIRRNHGAFLNLVVRQIALQNKFDDEYSKWEWKKMNLRNDKDIKNLILSYYDRGLIPVKTALEEGNYDFDRELDEKKKEIEENMGDVFNPPNLPFSTPKSGVKSNPTSDNGRPANDTKPEKTIKNPIDTVNTTTASYEMATADNHLFISALNDIVLQRWNKMKEDLNDKVKKDKQIHPDDIDLIIAYGFMGIERAIKNSIEIIFNSITDANSNELREASENDEDVIFDYSIYKDRLKAFEIQHLDKFMKSMITDLNKINNTGLEEDLLVMALSGVFDKQQDRLLQYPINTIITTETFANVANFASKGYRYCVWHTQLDNKVCSICEAREDKTFRISPDGDLDTLMELAEPHPVPGQRCYFAEKHGTFEFHIDLSRVQKRLEEKK